MDLTTGKVLEAKVENDVKSWERRLLHEAHNGNLEVVKDLVQNGINVNAKDAKHFTALHLASLKGHLDVVVLLLEYGAEVNVTNKRFVIVVFTIFLVLLFQNDSQKKLVKSKTN